MIPFEGFLKVKEEAGHSLGFLFRCCKDEHQMHQCVVPDTAGGCYKQVLETVSVFWRDWANRRSFLNSANSDEGIIKSHIY